MTNYTFRNVYILMCSFCLLVAASSCSVNKQISRKASKLLLQDSAIRQGHIGISIYEPATGKFWYEHDAEKYFVPASNTKLFTLYAGMKYLGDSLVGLKYVETSDTIFFEGTGDPTFLHADFVAQPAFSFLTNSRKPKVFRANSKDNFDALGSGWAWNDFESSYMVERSALPAFGNIVTFRLKNDQLVSTPASFAENLYMVIPADGKFSMHRQQDANKFSLSADNTKFTSQEIPFKTGGSATALDQISDSIGGIPLLQVLPGLQNASKLFSQPSDSLFKPMMHRSDNFFAEQTLLMTSNTLLGYMNESALIDSLLKTDLKDLQQKPKWVDGSGLSRYNLFTPQSFVYLLNKMKNDFGWERMKNILPTGGEGTLSSYYKTEQGFIYAKTGTLSNNCALSGYLTTKKNKLLVFSVLANNYQTSATPVRRAVEKFLKGLREQY